MVHYQGGRSNQFDAFGIEIHIPQEFPCLTQERQIFNHKSTLQPLWSLTTPVACEGQGYVLNRVTSPL
jgi:hypothetical protein